MKILFVTVGVGNTSKMDSLAGSILKSILTQNPDYTVFLCSKDSVSTANRVIELSDNRLKCDENCAIYDDIDKEDVNKAFRRIYDIMKNNIEILHADNIVVNYTSGTKTMSVAAALSGIFLHADFIYVAVEKSKMGEPIPGTENVRHFQPYSVRDREILKIIASYFSKYYIFTALQQVSNLVGFEYKECLKKVLEGYWKWNLFNYSSAYDILSSCDEEEIKHIFRDVDKFRKNVKFLKACRGISDESAKIEDLKVKYSYVLIDLLLNAERNYEIGRYDDAVARLYRALEMIAQLELLKYGYKDPVKEEDIKDEHREIFEMFKSSKTQNEYTLPLYKKMMLLSMFNSPVALSFLKDEDVALVLQYRNYSFLAHGFVPVEREKYEKMMSIVVKYVKLVFENMKGVNFEKMLDMGKFPKMVWSVM